MPLLKTLAASTVPTAKCLKPGRSRASSGVRVTPIRCQSDPDPVSKGTTPRRAHAYAPTGAPARARADPCPCMREHNTRAYARATRSRAAARGGGGKNGPHLGRYSGPRSLQPPSPGNFYALSQERSPSPQLPFILAIPPPLHDIWCMRTIETLPFSEPTAVSAAPEAAQEITTTDVTTAISPSPEPTSLDLVALLKDGRHFAEHRGEHTHIIDSITGVSVVVLHKDPSKALSQKLIQVETPEGLVWTQEGVRVPTHFLGSEYNPLVLDLLCQRIVEGKGVTEVCKEPGMPSYNTLCKWRRQYPEVGVAIENAKRERAEILRDKIMVKAERTYASKEGTRDEVPALAVLVDATKWTTAVDNEKYNPKAKIEANISMPTVIQVVTGISRE